MWRWCAPPIGRRGFRPTSSRSSTTWDGSSDTADVVVCRAGATTLAEIAAAGKAAILIPLPTATDDHQRKNAEALASAGAAEMLLQRDATGAVLADADSGAGRRSRSAASGWRRPRGRWRGRTRRGSIVDRALDAGAVVTEQPAERRRARQDAARAFHRDRRHRHERHRRAAGESRLRRQRLGREALGGDRSAGDAGDPGR